MRARPIEIMDDHARIPLTQGMFAIIDLADVPLVEGRNWRARQNGYVTYVEGRARSGPGEGSHNTLLHRLLLKPLRGVFVDHIDGDGLNNRRANLRLASRAENNRNCRMSRRNTSGFKGVSFSKASRRWQAQIRFQGRLHHLGLFDAAEDAAVAYQAAALRLHGEFARVA